MAFKASCYVIRGRGTKHGKSRQQYGPLEYAQAALYKLHSEGRFPKIDARGDKTKLVQTVRDELKKDPAYCARWRRKPISRNTVLAAWEIVTAEFEHDRREREQQVRAAMERFVKLRK
jgi:hypothetical protein